MGGQQLSGLPQAIQSNDPIAGSTPFQHNANHASAAWQNWQNATHGWNPNHNSLAWQSWEKRTHGWNPTQHNLQSLVGIKM